MAVRRKRKLKEEFYFEDTARQQRQRQVRRSRVATRQQAVRRGKSQVIRRSSQQIINKGF